MKLSPLSFRSIASLLLLSLATTDLRAQSYVVYEEVSVRNSTDTYQHPWAGGLNNPQFSHIDIDGNGTQDLFIFDRDGNKVVPFLYDGSSGVNGYTYAPWEEKHFPDMEYWALLRDLNCDGVEDIITSWDKTGAVVYEGVRSGTSLSYNIDTTRLSYLQDGFNRFVGITEIDIPAFEDVDGDGDIDLLTFNLGGGYVEYFQNQAAENGDPCGPLDFVLVDECWGRFYESGLSVAVDLDTCMDPAPLQQVDLAMNRGRIHAGSTFMLFDEEGDGDWDLVLGDLSFQKLNKLVNGGTPDDALMISQDVNFPSYDVSFEQNSYPAPFSIDVDMDGQRDMLVSPNSITNGEGIHNVWYYRDVDPSEAVTFELQMDSFLTGDMIETDRGSGPVFFDHNQDGLLDIVIGNAAYTPDIGAKVAALSLYENVGTASDPEFELLTNDYAGIRLFGFENVHPAFGDLDNDGDEDLVIGVEEGDLHYFANNPIGSDANFILTAPAYQGIDPGKTSTPFLVDLDRDGDLDLLIGERNGNLNYFENQGDASTATFVEITETLGDVVITSGETNIGYIQPWIIENSVGEYELFVGELQGRIYRYTDIEGNLTGSWTLADSNYANLDEGSRSKVALADINDDEELELLTGNLRGGLTLYKEGEYPSTGLSDQIAITALNVYPNPASGVFSLEIPEHRGQLNFRIYDVLGSLRVAGKLQSQENLLRVETAGWPEGLYLVELTGEQLSGIARVMIGR